jgi:hypothetical protein
MTNGCLKLGSQTAERSGLEFRLGYVPALIPDKPLVFIYQRIPSVKWDSSFSSPLMVTVQLEQYEPINHLRIQ